MKNLLLILSFTFAFSLSSQTNWQWALTPSNDLQKNNFFGSMALDQNDNIVVSGSYSGSFALGGSTLAAPTGTSNSNSFVAKLNKFGVVNWLHASESSNGIYFSCVSTDAIGNSYVLGAFTVSMQASGLQLNAPGNSDALSLLKYGPSGNLIWAKAIGSGAFSPRSIKCEGNKLYIGGTRAAYLQTPTLSIGTYTYNSASRWTIFYAKLDTSGNVLNASAYSGFKENGEFALAVSPNGNTSIYATSTLSTLVLGTVSLTAITNTNYASAILFNLDQNHQINWAKRIDNRSNFWGGQICGDNSNNIYLSTSFFNPALVVDNLSFSSNNIVNGLLIKFDAFGNALWGKSFAGLTSCNSTPEFAQCTSVQTDNNDNVSVSVACVGSSLSIGNFVTGLPNLACNYSGLYTVQFSATGTPAGVLYAGGVSGIGTAHGLLIDKEYNVITGGDFYGTPLSFGSLNLQGYASTENNRIFVAKASGIITGIRETTLSTGLTAFPIPSTSEIIFTSENTRLKTILLFDLSGKQVAHKTCTESKEELSLVDLAAGIYIARVETQDHQVKTLKVVKVE